MHTKMAPSNALCMIQSEVSLMLTALRCSTRSSYRINQEEIKRPLYLSFNQLKLMLNDVTSISELEPLVYLAPFLEVIRSENTTGSVTGLALTAVAKFLSYGLLELPSSHGFHSLTGPGSLASIAIAAEAIADAGTQARFIGTDPRSDEVVLMKVLYLLRTLLLVPAGNLISDRAVREILQSCFRICFEQKLSELLRRTAELCLASMVQLFFIRLPNLSGFRNDAFNNVDSTSPCLFDADSPKKSVVPKRADCKTKELEEQFSPNNDHSGTFKAVSSSEDMKILTDVQSKGKESPINGLNEELIECSANDSSDQLLPSTKTANSFEENVIPLPSTTLSADLVISDSTCKTKSDSFVEQKSESDVVSNEINAIQHYQKLKNFTNHHNVHPDMNNSKSYIHPQPYSVTAVHDLFYYLIKSLKPSDNQHSSADSFVITTSLSLITIALETGADNIANCPCLLQLVRGDLTKHLMLLLYSEGVWQFAAALRVCFLLFESMRSHLKLQMEVYLQRLNAISSLDNELTCYERREIALDSVVCLFLLPGLTTELYINYDCDLYCSNLFEDIVKMLTKNAFPIERLMGTNLLALDALLAVLNTIETQTKTTLSQPSTSSSSSIPFSHDDINHNFTKNYNLLKSKCKFNRHFVDLSRLPTREQLNNAKCKKKLLMIGSDQFNTKPKRGVAFLQEHNLLKTPLDHNELAIFLRENPRLDKRMIGEYISARENVDILNAFVKQFNFSGVSIDEALRVYLEAFRLPGEAPLIQRIMEHFAEEWHRANHEPFADADAAFTLAYAILMLNTDQHNPNSKRQNAPMRMEEFKKNLNGMNGNEDFDPKLLENIFNNIHNCEIVMPSEQTGLVRENYLWKCLLRRSSTRQAEFIHVQTGLLDSDLFELIWGPTVSALSFIFDKTTDPDVQTKSVDGFNRCATIAAYYGMSDVLDNLVIALCKFTTLLTATDNSLILPVTLGRNGKACLALRLVFTIAARHADILRYGWHSLLDCLLQLFRSNLLSDELLESQDFLVSSRRVRLTTKGCIPIIESRLSRRRKRENRKHGQKTYSQQSHSANREFSVLTSFYQYLTTGSSWMGSGDEDDDNDDDDDDDDVIEEDYDDKNQINRSQLNLKSTESLSTTKSKLNNYSKLEQKYIDLNHPNLLLNITNRNQLDEETATQLALNTIKQCQIEQLIEDSKFLVDPSLTELIKALLRAIRGDSCSTLADNFEADFNANFTSALATVPDSTYTSNTGLVHDVFPEPNMSQSTYSSDHESLNTNDVNLSNPLISDNLVTNPNSRNSSMIGSQLPGSQTNSYYPAFCSTNNGTLSDDCRIFCLELLIRVLMHNRDRLVGLWPLVRSYLVEVLLAPRSSNLIVERIIVGFLRLATCLLRRHEMTSQIFACLYWLLFNWGEQLLYPITISSGNTNITIGTSDNLSKHNNSRNLNQKSESSILVQGSKVGRQIIAGLTDLLRNHAADLPDPTTDWKLIFGLLEVCGAGRRSTPCRVTSKQFSGKTIYASSDAIGKFNDNSINPKVFHKTIQNESNRGYTSDNETFKSNSYHRSLSVEPVSILMNESESIRNSENNAIKLNDNLTINSSHTIFHQSSEKQQNSGSKDSLVDNQDTSTATTMKQSINSSNLKDVNSKINPIILSSNLLSDDVFIGTRDPLTLEQAAECLAFLVRDPAHITPENFEYCVKALRVFVEACLRSPFGWKNYQTNLQNKSQNINKTNNTTHRLSRTERSILISKQQSNRSTQSNLSDSDTDLEFEIEEKARKEEWIRENYLSPTTSVVAIQILELINTLFTRATSIYTEWTRISSDHPISGIVEEPGNPNTESTINNTVAEDLNQTHVNLEYVWIHCWCPLLQATARLCCDVRREVRTDALNYLQRALLSPILHSLNGKQWEDCFEKVLFPLLSGFLESITLEESLTESSDRRLVSNNSNNRDLMSGTSSSFYFHTVEFVDPRMRAIPLLTKVFLQHLRPLYNLDTFNSLWLRMLTYMEYYMHASKSDSLTDAVRESLKNVLLVMCTGTYDISPILIKDATVDSDKYVLWKLTEEKIIEFLPELLEQLFPPTPTPPIIETNVTDTVSEYPVDSTNEQIHNIDKSENLTDKTITDTAPSKTMEESIPNTISSDSILSATVSSAVNEQLPSSITTHHAVQNL